MKKYKLLVNREYRTSHDFMRHTGKYFTTTSTLCDFIDLKNHFDIMKPDAFVVFVGSEDNDFVETVNTLHDNPEYNSVPVIFVGNNEMCNKMSRKYPSLAKLYIRLPITDDNIALQILWYLEETNENAGKKADLIFEDKDTGKKRILAVDDDRNVLKILKATLGETYDVTTMANGLLVEKFIENNDVHMILLDHEMPKESGAEVFERLQNHPKSKNIPVCFLTGVSERTEIEKIMRLRPQGYLLKPVNIEMLQATIKNLIL